MLHRHTLQNANKTNTLSRMSPERLPKYCIKQKYENCIALKIQCIEHTKTRPHVYHTFIVLKQNHLTITQAAYMYM